MLTTDNLHTGIRPSLVATVLQFGGPATEYLLLPMICGNRKTSPPTPGLIPVGRSTWHAGVRDGRFPKPYKGFGPRISVWRVEDILALINKSK